MSPSPDLSAREQARLLEWMVDHLEAVRADSVPQRAPYGEPSRLCLAIWASMHLGLAVLLAGALARLVLRLLRPRLSQAQRA